MNNPTNTFVGHVGRIEPDFIGGWAADTANPESIIDVVVYIDGNRVAQVSCGEFRQDLLELKVYGRGHHGFRHNFATPVPMDLLDRITVRFAQTGAIVPNGEKILPGGETITPILVTAPGRSGTTLMMSRLSLSPQICVAETPPYEVRLISYWATVVKTLSAEADYEHSTHPDKLEGDGFMIGSNPFSHSEYRGVFLRRELENEYFGRYVTQRLSDTARALIREYYHRIKVDRQKASAIFFAEKNNNLHRPTREFARAVFPNLKEIVIVRDPRDLFCSQLSYFRNDPDRLLDDMAGAAGELIRIKKEEAAHLTVVKYEDMILDTKHVLQDLSCYLGVGPFPPPEETREQSVFSVHATSKTPEASVGRWRSDLSSELKSACASIFEQFISEFGYKAAT